jgi:hypothetical protein
MNIYNIPGLGLFTYFYTVTDSLRNRLTQLIRKPISSSGSPEESSRVSNTHATSQLDVAVHPINRYRLFKKEMARKPGCCRKKYINLLDNNGLKRKERLISRLGSGAHKDAIKLSGGRALIVPNFRNDKAEQLAETWERTIDNEISVSARLSASGLLSMRPEKVLVSFSGESIPAYICPSFESLRQKNWFIIDVNVEENSTREKIFDSEEERYSIENWKTTLKPLFDDLTELFEKKLPRDPDSISLVLIKNPLKSLRPIKQRSIIRAFGFDFPPDKEYQLRDSEVSLTIRGLVWRMFQSEFPSNISGKKLERIRELESLVAEYGIETVVTQLREKSLSTPTP